MVNLATTYNNVGRHQDALVLQEKALEIQRRVLPENHPDIGDTCFNISISYQHTGNNHQAIERACEALHIRQITLPPSHPHIEQAQTWVRQIEVEIARCAKKQPTK
jgi:hypothetical protein